MGTGDRLLDIACNVCEDRSSGKHYGIYSCDGCSGFFKRSIHSNREYTCKAQGPMKGRCPIDKTHRNQCRACRLTKCFQAGMNKDGTRLGRWGSIPGAVECGIVGSGDRVGVDGWQFSRARCALQRNGQHQSIHINDKLDYATRRVAKCRAVQHERGPRKPKPHPDKHHSSQQSLVTTLSSHPGSPVRHEPRVDINPHLFPHHSPVVNPLSPLSTPPGHHERARRDRTASHLLSIHRRLRYVPYHQPPSLMQKPPDDGSTPVSFPLQLPPPNPGLYHSASVALGQQPPLLQILMSAEKCQPDGEGSLDQAETEASVSPTGTLQPFSPTWEVLQETTARLLFMAVRWVRCLAPFQTLFKEDRLVLLQQTWTQLFLLHLAQWSVSWDISGLLEDEQVRRRLPPDEASLQELHTIQEIMCRFRQLSPDGGECGCMKAVVLFRPETKGLTDPKPVEMLQDQAQCILGDYIRSRYPRQPERFGRFLLSLPMLHAVKPTTVELLFFRETIGDIPIARLLGDMYKMEHHSSDGE